MTDTQRYSIATRRLIAVLALAALAASAQAAQGTELIPSFGMTKSTDSNSGNARGFGGLALRAPVLPFLKLEGAIGYRQDSFSNDAVKVRQWPVTASAWVSPLPMMYAGGGLGWYRTTLDIKDNAILRDVTTNKVGVHIGGGVGIPLAPQLGLDLNGRYIFMQKDSNNIQVPKSFNPDFWTLGLGLAIKF